MFKFADLVDFKLDSVLFEKSVLKYYLKIVSKWS